MSDFKLTGKLVNAQQLLEALFEPQCRPSVRWLWTQTKAKAIPFVRIGSVRARFVDIADDRTSVKAYFDTAPPARGRIEFGYDDQVLLRFSRGFTRAQVARLDEARLAPALRYQARLFGQRG